MNTGRLRLAYALLAVVAIAHIVLAIVYANITPYRTAGRLSYQGWQMVPDIGTPDERQHANYVIGLLAGEGLPVYRVNVPDPTNPGKTIRNPELGEIYEDHQAPLYYILDAGFGKLAGVDEISARDPSAGLKLRYLNALFGALTVIGVFFLAWWGLQRLDVGLLAATIAALLPMNIALSGAVTNDPLLFCDCTWFLAVCALAIRQGWNWKRAVGAGLLIGIGLETKDTALALFPIALCAFYLRRPAKGQGITTFVLSLLIGAPFWIRNQMLYGDPLGLKSFKELFAGAMPASFWLQRDGFIGYWVNWVGWWTARSFFGAFSYMDIFLNETGTPYTGPGGPNTVYRLLLGLAVIGGLGFVLALGKEKLDRRFHLLNGVFLALIVVFFIRYNISYFQGQARYFYPAIGPISIALAIGGFYWAKSRKRLVAGAITVILLMLNVYAIVRLPTEFARRVSGSSPNPTASFEHP